MYGYIDGPLFCNTFWFILETNVNWCMCVTLHECEYLFVSPNQSFSVYMSADLRPVHTVLCRCDSSSNDIFIASKAHTVRNDRL